MLVKLFCAVKPLLAKDHQYRALDATKIEQAYIPSGIHCLLRYVKNCETAKVTVVPATDGRVLCELLSSDKYSSSENVGQTDSLSSLQYCCK